MSPTYDLLADTGVQYICHPLSASEATDVRRWRRHVFANNSPDARVACVQWQALRTGRTPKLFLAVDTTCGNPACGFFDDENMAQDRVLEIDRLTDDASNEKLSLPDPIRVRIRHAASTAGADQSVHLVIDFGNSRTGALLIEPSRDNDLPTMEPFELINQYALNAWSDQGQLDWNDSERRSAGRWFSSRTHWCATPFQQPPERWITRPRKDAKGEKEAVRAVPRLFQNLSCVRMGAEADDVTRSIVVDRDTGVSSPKRYLWADDVQWLAGGIWYMADPHDRYAPPERAEHAVPLQGSLLAFLKQQSPHGFPLEIDRLLKSIRDGLDPQRRDEVLEDEQNGFAPPEPRHPPCMTMTAALYEIVCQAYVFANSTSYRAQVAQGNRRRVIKSVSLSYPTGMVYEERRRLKTHAENAVRLFAASLGRRQPEPDVSLAIDEASATHLTWLWSELQQLDYDPDLLFTLCGRKARPAAVAASAQPALAASSASGAFAARDPRSSSRGSRSSGGRSEEPAVDNRPELTIACIDIGGGTSDLMIARYKLRDAHVTEIEGEVLRRDGISKAGDELVKQLLQEVVIPRFAEATSLNASMVRRIFEGLKVHSNRYKLQRVGWMNRLFVPLAQAYLERAGLDDTETAVSHTDPEIVAPDVVDMMQESVDELLGPGNVRVDQPLDLYYDPADLERVVNSVFSTLIAGFCERIVEAGADIVLLSGQPTRLKSIQQLVRRYAGLPSDRVTPMHEYYAGNWYPYQTLESHGTIADPKSTVVVGAALKRMIDEGRLHSVRFKVAGFGEPSKASPCGRRSFFWGQLTPSTGKIRNRHLLFLPSEDDRPVQFTFEASTDRVLIGRRSEDDERAEATPIYVLLSGDALRGVDAERRGGIDLQVTVERFRNPDTGEEELRLARVVGEIGQEKAAFVSPGHPENNVDLKLRTLISEHHYLDTGALEEINCERLAN